MRFLRKEKVMFGFLKRKHKVEQTAREELIFEIENEYDIWLTHIGDMSREIKRIPDLIAQQSTIEKLETGNWDFLKEGDSAEILKKMNMHYTGRINDCARAAIAEFKALSSSWERICEIRRKLDADTKGIKEGV